jgi:hypothetical protein
MKLYTIRLANGQYLKQPSSKNDTELFTDDITNSNGFIVLSHLHNIINFAKGKDREKYKGACIIEKHSGKVIEHIRIYNNVLEDAKVIKQTEKAIMIDYKGMKEWLPLSQCEISEDIVVVSDWIYKEKFNNEASNNTDSEIVQDIV